MKNALILHGTNGHSQENWFPWLHNRLEGLGYAVWTPDLPGADKPNIQRYNQFIFSNQNFQFNQDTITIGHSSGAVAILGLLQAMPESTKVAACYLVGSFKDDLEWEALSDLFVEPLNYEVIKKRSQLWYFIHSDNDPYCPLEHAQYLHHEIGGDLIVLPGQKHFSVGSYGEKYKEFPYLYHLIAADAMTSETVKDICEELSKAGVEFWLDGGWGIDALLNRQTRPHNDLDLIIEQKYLPKLNEYFKKLGYREILRSDTRPENFMMGDDQPRLIDVHVINLDDKGNGIYGPVENGQVYPAEALVGKGMVDGLMVRCVTFEWQVKSHQGYTLRSKDLIDLKVLKQKFGVE